MVYVVAASGKPSLMEWCLLNPAQAALATKIQTLQVKTLLSCAILYRKVCKDTREESATATRDPLVESSEGFDALSIYSTRKNSQIKAILDEGCESVSLIYMVKRSVFERRSIELQKYYVGVQFSRLSIL